MGETPNQVKMAQDYPTVHPQQLGWSYGLRLYPGQNWGVSAEGHVSHILSARLSSRPMGWSKTGVDQMARMRAPKPTSGD